MNLQRIFSQLTAVALLWVLVGCMGNTTTLNEKRTGFVLTDGAELYYEDIGSGPVVILVHGSSGNSEHWNQQVPALVDAGFRCIKFDLRSFGRSRSAPGKGNNGTIAGDIERIRQELNLGKVFVVGQSHGSEGALEYGLDYRDHSLGVVIASTWKGAEDEPAYAELRAKLSPSAKQLESIPRVEIQFSEHYRVTNPDGINRFVDIENRYKRNGVPASLSIRDSVQKQRVPTDYARLSTISVPVLVLTGENDTITSPRLMKEFANNIPGARYATVPDAGRYAFWEKPNAFNTIVIEFLSAQSMASPNRSN